MRKDFISLYIILIHGFLIQTTLRFNKWPVFWGSGKNWFVMVEVIMNGLGGIVNGSTSSKNQKLTDINDGRCSESAASEDRPLSP